MKRQQNPGGAVSAPALPRRRFLQAAAGVGVAAGLSSTLAACGGSGSSGGNVTLHLWDTDTRPERTANLKKLISMFEAKNPGIRISYLGLPTDQYMQKINTAIATRSTPDLLTPKASDIAALVAQKALAPLDERLKAAGLEPQISAQMLKSSRAAAPDGKLYLTPATSLADVIYYRADWFKQAGLKPPATWQDFDAAARRLTDASKGRFGYTLRGGNGFFPQMVEMVYPRAGVTTFFRQDGTCTLDDPAVISACEAYVALFGKQTARSDLTADFKTLVAQFGKGGAAMLSHSIGSFPNHVTALGADKVGVVAPFPGPGPRVLSGWMTTGFAMFRASKHQDAAWKFLAYTMEQEGNSFWAQKSGYLPGNKAVAQEKWVTENAALKAALDAAATPGAVTLEQPYYLPEFTSITTTDLLPQWQKVLQGNLSSRDFLTAAAASLTKVKSKYDKEHR
ncbi:sugar ABC transporter substrate-binding protein [Actinoallomurus purpureus]|uniref:ABC transporter substrate-binding protein n=1 Tax=Actinoallomurus purpureus TaxID=478114 RepID=UPI00209289CA|nr:sugar ABC transporter substrate-binding protein [Actinoallomurus purpureus]MCO6005426.1 sugar ABC transporter substrate-binding protein [Actinoallomurus purpureus]